MYNILVTGGGGYKGTKLADSLLKAGHRVTLMDNFMYGFQPVLGFVEYENCTIQKQDIRSVEKKDLKDYDIIYHLAGISGYPACEANPHAAEMINVYATRRIVDLLSKNQVLVYASTTSFYGSSGQMKDEDSVIEPVSLYGRTKYEAEKICMDKENSISLRFATLFGVSRRMRCDLLVNDFVLKAITERNLVLFDSKSIRTYLHLQDAVNSYMLVLTQMKHMLNGVFNVGSNDFNFSKLDLAQKIKKYIDFKIIDSDLSDFDKRSFIVNYDKISKLGFKTTVSMDQGILELKKLYSFYRPFSLHQALGNV